MIEQLVDNDPQFYNKIRGDLITQSSWGFSLQHVESVKSMHDNLNALALIVRFLTAGIASSCWFIFSMARRLL